MLQRHSLFLYAVVCDGLLLPRSRNWARFNPVPLPPRACINQMYWTLCDGQNQAADTTNTLVDGEGAGGGEFRIRNIAVVEGQALDLVLTVPSDSEYNLTNFADGSNRNFAHVSPNAGSKHQEFTPAPPCWIVIPWKAGTVTKFNWKFVNSGTSDKASNLIAFTLGAVELDQETENDREYITFDTHYTKLIHQGVSVNSPTMPTYAQATFRSIEVGSMQDNPSISGPTKANCVPTANDPYGCLGDNQEGRTVQVEYEERAEWEMTLGHETDATSEGDRFLEFYGTVCTEPPQACGPTRYWDLCAGGGAAAYTNTFQTGLGARGGEFRITSIATVGGTTIDLVLSVPGSELYRVVRNSAHVSPSGTLQLEGEGLQGGAEHSAPPCWIVIPLKEMSATKFNWKFVLTGTNTSFELVTFTLAVAELDQQAQDDHEWVRFDTAYTDLMSKGSHVTQSVHKKRERFDSTQMGTVLDNPSVSGPRDDCEVTTAEPYSCMTTEQMGRSLHVRYENLAEFDLTLGHTSRSSRSNDRFFEFFGTTCT